MIPLNKMKIEEKNQRSPKLFKSRMCSEDDSTVANSGLPSGSPEYRLLSPNLAPTTVYCEPHYLRGRGRLKRPTTNRKPLTANG